jgi:hypothetical protein
MSLILYSTFSANIVMSFELACVIVINLRLDTVQRANWRNSRPVWGLSGLDMTTTSSTYHSTVEASAALQKQLVSSQQTPTSRWHERNNLQSICLLEISLSDCTYRNYLSFRALAMRWLPHWATSILTTAARYLAILASPLPIIHRPKETPALSISRNLPPPHMV